MQRTPQRDQYPLGWRQGTGRVTAKLGIDPGKQRGKGEWQIVVDFALVHCGKQTVKLRATGCREILPRYSRIDYPGGSFSLAGGIDRGANEAQPVEEATDKRKKSNK